MQKIILLTSGQPSLNPRLVKEADCLVTAGYQVTVLYQYWNSWGTVLDETLLRQKKWTALRVGGSPGTDKFIYWYSRFKHKVGQLAASRFGMSTPFAAMAIGRCTNLLVTEAVKHKADLYIAHNLAALPAAVKAAKKYRAKCGFDAEDFHRNEVTDDAARFDVRLKTFIEDQYLPLLNYFTTSSPLISEAYSALYPLAPLTILNAFPLKTQIKTPVRRDGDQLKLFWFSQTITADRGVADCIKALVQLKDRHIELHLLGYAPTGIKTRLTEAAGGFLTINFHEPIPADDLALFASQFDIGLAMEDSVPFNRDICLSNKIFTYAQAGLAIIASDTAAQSCLLAQHPAIGQVYKKRDAKALADAIAFYQANDDELLNARRAAIQTANQELNWEHESQKFLTIVHSTLTG